MFLYRDHDHISSHQPTTQQRLGVHDRSRSSDHGSGSGTKSANAKKNKQFNGYQTIISSDIHQYGGEYLVQSRGSGSSSSGGVNAGRVHASSLIVSEDLVRSNQLKKTRMR